MKYKNNGELPLMNEVRIIKPVLLEDFRIDFNHNIDWTESPDLLEYFKDIIDNIDKCAVGK